MPTDPALAAPDEVAWTTGDGAAPASQPILSVRFLLRDSAIYGLSNALVKLTALVTVPVLTRALAPTEYGATDVLGVVLALLVGMGTLGQDSAVARFYYDTDDRSARRQVVTQGLLTQLTMSVIVGILAVLIGPRVLRALSASQFASAYPLVVACVPLVVLFQFWRGHLKWVLARAQYVTLAVGSAVLNLALIVAMAKAHALTVETYFVAMLATNTASAALGLYFCRSYIAWPRGFHFVKPMLRFGAPYAVVLLISTSMPAVDRSIVSSQLGLASLALYAVGLKFASLLLFPVTAFQTAWGPFCYATYKEAAAADVYSRVLWLLTALLAVTCFGLVALAEPLIRVFASQAYASGARVVLPLAFGLAAEACSWVLGLGIDLSKRSELSLVSYALGLGVALTCAWLLVRPMGIFGVAIGMSIGRAAQAAAYSSFGLHVYPLRIRWRKPLVLMLAALAASTVAVAVRPASTAGIIGVRITAGAVLLGIIALQLGRSEYAQVRLVLRGLAHPRGGA